MFILEKDFYFQNRAGIFLMKKREAMELQK